MHLENGTTGATFKLDQATMTTDQFLRSRQAQAGTFRLAGDQRIKHRVLQFRFDAGAVIFDFDADDDWVAGLTVQALRAELKRRGVAGYSGKRKAELCEMLRRNV